MRRADKVGRVQLVFVQGVVPEGLEHVGQQLYVAQKIKRYVLFETLAVEVFPHVLGVRVVCLLALNASKLVEEGLSWR